MSSVSAVLIRAEWESGEEFEIPVEAEFIWHTMGDEIEIANPRNEDTGEEVSLTEDEEAELIRLARVELDAYGETA